MRDNSKEIQPLKEISCRTILWNMNLGFWVRNYRHFTCKQPSDPTALWALAIHQYWLITAARVYCRTQRDAFMGALRTLTAQRTLNFRSYQYNSLTETLTEDLLGVLQRGSSEKQVLWPQRPADTQGPKQSNGTHRRCSGVGKLRPAFNRLDVKRKSFKCRVASIWIMKVSLAPCKGVWPSPREGKSCSAEGPSGLALRSACSLVGLHTVWGLVRNAGSQLTRPTNGPEKVMSVIQEDPAIPTTSSGRLHKFHGIWSYFPTWGLGTLCIGQHGQSSTHRPSLHAHGLQIWSHPCTCYSGEATTKKGKNHSGRNKQGPQHSRLSSEQQTKSLPLGGHVPVGSIPHFFSFSKSKRVRRMQLANVAAASILPISFAE